MASQAVAARGPGDHMPDDRVGESDPLRSRARTERQMTRRRRPSDAGFLSPNSPLWNDWRMARSVVVTGASTGIGKATALRLAAAGWHVWAGVRSDADGGRLARDGGQRLTPVHLDVTDQVSIQQAVTLIGGTVGSGGLGGLVNNAGIPGGGPIEYLPLDDWRRANEVNVIGQVAVTQAFLPLLRAARGRIVFIGSIAGRISTPLGAPYQASKHALEAIAGSLRHELAPAGIKVALIEPGAIKTPLWDKTLTLIDDVGRSLPAEGLQRYGAFIEASRRFTGQGTAPGIPADRVASVVESALTSTRPRARYLVGLDAKMLGTLTRLLPNHLLDLMIAKRAGPGAGARAGESVATPRPTGT
jgi:NAD(P)-dependent dehydrogenase (short-subunit alcohol dehydrogenase family)